MSFTGGWVEEPETEPASFIHTHRPVTASVTKQASRRAWGYRKSDPRGGREEGMTWFLFCHSCFSYWAAAAEQRTTLWYRIPQPASQFIQQPATRQKRLVYARAFGNGCGCEGLYMPNWRFGYIPAHIPKSWVLHNVKLSLSYIDALSFCGWGCLPESTASPKSSVSSIPCFAKCRHVWA